MTRENLEATVWRIGGRQLTGQAVDALVDLAEAYAAERVAAAPRRALHHTGGDDLHQLIGVLAGALLGDAPEDELAARRRERGAA